MDSTISTLQYLTAGCSMCWLILTGLRFFVVVVVVAGGEKMFMVVACFSCFW